MIRRKQHIYPKEQAAYYKLNKHLATDGYQSKKTV